MIDPTAVKEILERMRVADPEFRVFGAVMHQYRLGPTVPEAELRKFEETYCIRLTTATS